ncbi:MAG: hypothetical protein GWO39_00060, partial [Gammaproteobacteria bacterium]|nr:hypothetical protein [Gammaproteobacteria bacterium]NIY30822.1 hypothetical protein [Gammaproteobacteria bacterium]
ASALLGVTFGPFALFNALTRSLPGPLITFGIDAMIDTFRFLGIDVADTAKLAEQAMAMLLSFVLGALSGPILLLILRRRQGPDARLVGTAFGTAVGLIAGALVANFGREQVSVFLEAGWALLAGAAWGAVLGSALSRLGPAEGVALEAQEDTAEVEVLSRRQF